MSNLLKVMDQMKTMNKLMVAVMAAGLLASPVWADSATNARVQQLERQVRLLEQRVSLLEQRLAVVGRPNPSRQNYYVCRISAFATQFEGESPNQGLAKRQAQRACQAKYEGFFCQMDQVRCEQY